MTNNNGPVLVEMAILAKKKIYNLIQPGEGLEVHKVPELTLNVNNFRYTFSQFLTMVLPTFIHAL